MLIKSWQDSVCVCVCVYVCMYVCMYVYVIIQFYLTVFELSAPKAVIKSVF